MIIESTTDYTLSVAQNEVGKKYYSIVNNVTGVEELGEAKEMLLPQAHDYLTQMQSHLDALRDSGDVVLNG